MALVQLLDSFLFGGANRTKGKPSVKLFCRFCQRDVEGRTVPRLTQLDTSCQIAAELQARTMQLVMIRDCQKLPFFVLEDEDLCRILRKHKKIIGSTCIFLKSRASRGTAVASMELNGLVVLSHFAPPGLSYLSFSSN